MTANALRNLSQIESSLWEAADQLRANSKLTSSEYCMPVLGVIFLRHATNRYQAALKTIQADQATGKSPNRPLVKGDFIKRSHRKQRTGACMPHTHIVTAFDVAQRHQGRAATLCHRGDPQT